jgi:hypothetical protein
MRSRRGSTSLQVVLSLAMMLGFAALTIDVGRIATTRAELQNASEAAAMGAAVELGDPAEVRRVAIEIAAMNWSGGAPVVIDEADVHIGTYAPDTREWIDDESGEFVRVDTSRDDVQFLFAWALGATVGSAQGRSIAGVVSEGGWAGPCLMFAEDGLELNGNATVDGYDSSVGYDFSASSDGAVCTNADLIELQGNYALEGHAHPGPDGTVEVSGSSYVTGDTSPLEEEIVLASVSRPASYSSLPETVRTATTLSAGTYYRSGNFTVNARGTVTTTGAVKIYVDGDVTINGNGFVNTGEDPHELTIYVIGNHSVHVNGNSDFHGVIYAPDSEVELNGTSDFYGALFGRTIHHNGTGDVHLDTTLADTAPEGSTAGTSRARLYY